MVALYEAVYTHTHKVKFVTWSHIPGKLGHLCTKQALCAGAMQSPGARARSLQEY